MKNELREKAERIARRIPNRKATEPQANTEERRAKRQRHERLAQRIEKKKRSERNFDEQLARAIEFTREARDAAYCYARLTGKVDHSLVLGEPGYMPGDVCTRVSEEEHVAAPKRVPNADTIGAPVVNGNGVGWRSSQLNRVDRGTEAYLGVRPERRESRDFPDWRKAWTENYKAHVSQRYGWKPYEKGAVGPNLAVAADWLTAKRHAYLFVDARRGKPKAEEPHPWESYGPPIPAPWRRSQAVSRQWELKCRRSKSTNCCG